MLELLLAISITIMTGAAAAAVSTAVARGMSSVNLTRSALLRAHLVMERIRAVTDPGLCVLDADASRGIAVWLNDSRVNGQVNVSELRVFWFDAANRKVTEEKVQFPADQTDDWYAVHDLVVASSDDPFAVMVSQRRFGYTTTQPVGDAITVNEVTYEQGDARSSVRFRIAATVHTDRDEPLDILGVLSVPNRQEPK